MDRSQSPDRPQRIQLLTLALIAAALYFGREVLIPLALALMISFILTPLVHGLQQLKLGRVPAVLIVVALVFGGVGLVAWTMARQVVDLAETLPKYEHNIRAKAASLRTELARTRTALDADRKRKSELLTSLVETLAHRMTGTPQDAEDVVQETFLKAYKQLGRFESRANFSTWLHRIAVNCSIDLIRARPRRETGHDADDLAQLGAVDR